MVKSVVSFHHFILVLIVSTERNYGKISRSSSSKSRLFAFRLTPTSVLNREIILQKSRNLDYLQLYQQEFKKDMSYARFIFTARKREQHVKMGFRTCPKNLESQSVDHNFFHQASVGNIITLFLTFNFSAFCHHIVTVIPP